MSDLIESPPVVVLPKPPGVKERLTGWFRMRKMPVALLILFAFVAINALIANQITEPLRFESRAAAHSASVTIKPTELALSGEKEMQVWIVPDFGASFIHVELTFDPSKLKLTKEFRVPADSAFTMTAKRTSAAEANRTGTIVFAAGLDPAKKDDPPSSAFHALTISIAPVTAANDTTAVAFSQSALQVVDREANPMSITANGAALVLNPVVATPTPLPTRIPTTAPTSGLTPTLTSTSTPTPVVCVAVNGTWEYGAWSTCTASCGAGLQFRTARCTGTSCGGTCAESPVKRRPCNTQACSTTVTVSAAGTNARGIYPTMQLLINDKVVAEWANVRGNPWLRRFHKYVYRSPGPVSVDEVKVRYVNDNARRGGDRNLRIDNIRINDTVYESEAASTYSVGSWSRAGGCHGGYKASEWLHCNGYMAFGAR